MHKASTNDMLSTLKVTRQCLLRLVTNNCQKITIRYGNLLKIKFDSEPVYGENDKYIKTKIKIYDGNVNTNFQYKGMPIEKPPCKC